MPTSILMFNAYMAYMFEIWAVSKHKTQRE